MDQSPTADAVGSDLFVAFLRSAIEPGVSLGVLTCLFAKPKGKVSLHRKELAQVRDSFARLIKWLSPSGRVGDTEVANEYPVSPWISGGIGRGAGTSETYQLGPKAYVRVAPVPAKASSSVHICYTGLLASKGSEAIYLRCGDGPGFWKNVRDVPMEYKADTEEWVANVSVSEQPGTMEFCFHDGADNWDNNSGRNWSITVLKNE